MGKPLGADETLVERAHHGRAPGAGREREAAADHLAEGAEVGGDAVIFLRAAKGETKPGDDLVEDQRDAVLGGDVARRLEAAGRRAGQRTEQADGDTRGPGRRPPERGRQPAGSAQRGDYALSSA